MASRSVWPGGGGGGAWFRARMGRPGTHQNHLGALGAEDFVGPGLAGLRGAVPLAMQLQAHGVVSHGVQELGHLA